jgi:hypothetical protein
MLAALVVDDFIDLLQNWTNRERHQHAPERGEEIGRRETGSGSPTTLESDGDARRDVGFRRGIVSCWGCFGWGGKERRVRRSGGFIGGRWRGKGGRV